MSSIQNQRFKGKTPTDTTASSAPALTSVTIAALNCYNTALDCLAIGQKFIPLKGDRAADPASEGKAPAVETWDNATMPTQPDAHRYFIEQGYTAIGRMQGRFAGDPTRGEITVDIDDPRVLERLAAYPHLLDTYTELSCIRRLPHLSYSIAGDLLDTPTTKGVFGSLLSNGSYVVAGGSVIDGGTCEVSNDKPRRPITKHDLPILLAAIGAPELEQYERDHAPAMTNGAPPSVETLLNFYLNYPAGRNTALFTTLTYARDCGITTDADAIQQLKRIFANERPRTYTSRAGYESIERRQREFSASLASVYKRAPRAMPMLTPAVMLNAIREALLQQKQDAAARLLDMLYSAGIEPGNAMTEKQIVELCAAKGISRKTIRKALETNARRIDLDTGEIIENRVFVPILYTPQSGAIAKAKTTCVVRCQNGDKNPTEGKSKGGRPSGTGKQYAIPTVDYMLDLLGIERENAKHADAIPADAVKTASSYRRAIHTALVKRTPEKQYSMRLLTQRLGVTRMTVYSYNKAAGIEAIPVYTRIPITWETVNSLPFVDIADADQNQQGRRFVRGMFIADVTNTDPAEIGEKHSPFAVIARRLLSERRTIYLCYQEANAWVYKPAIKRSAPIFKLQTVTPAAQPVPLAKAAGAESMTPPPTSQWGHTPDDNGVSRLNPFSRKGHTHHDPDADHPPA